MRIVKHLVLSITIALLALRALEITGNLPIPRNGAAGFDGASDRRTAIDLG